MYLHGFLLIDLRFFFILLVQASGCYCIFFLISYLNIVLFFQKWVCFNFEHSETTTQLGNEDVEDEWERRCAQMSCSPEAALCCPRRKFELHHNQVTFSGVTSFLHFKSDWLVENSHPWSPRVQRRDFLTCWSILMMFPSCRAVPSHLRPYKGLERCYSVTHLNAHNSSQASASPPQV